MYIPLGYKFILGFVIVIAVVAFVPHLIVHLNYAPEFISVLSYAVAITVGLIVGCLFSRSLSKNISRLTRSAEAISDGDLTCDVMSGDRRFGDEIDTLAAAVNRMGESLRDLVRHIGQTSEQVAHSAVTLSSSTLEINASSEEVAQAMEQISRGAETQAEMVTRVSKTIHEMAISVELIARKAKETARAARDTSLNAQRGGELANDSLERMKSFFEQAEITSQRFMELNARLQQVGKIADFIGEIARQTNMLALNASIEAARAGEYGKGFAVVADEIRKLADGTGKSATDISDVIAVIKEGSQSLYESFSASSKEISEGKKNIDVTAASFREILNTVIDTERKANSIADLSAMQNEGAAKMVEAIDEIAKVAEDNAAATEQVAAASQEQSVAMQEMTHAAKEMLALSEDLMKVVARFRVSGTEAPEE